MKIWPIVSQITAALVFIKPAFGQANGTIDYGPFPEDLNGSNFTYPWPVHLFKFKNQFQYLQMAFMDVEPSCEPNGRTVVLLHGNNFCSVTWEETISALSGSGYRVIAPDQIGYCKSTKPEAYQFSLHQFAYNTRGLLNAAGVGNVTVVGHSLGGMMAARFGLQYPETIDQMVMIDPIGLEDYIQKGVPYIPIDESAVAAAASTYESIKAYQQKFYYVRQWQASYDVWVKMLTNIFHGSQRAAFVKNQAQIVDMVLTEPIADYFDDVQEHTLLIVGDKDETAIGSAWAPHSVAAKLGHFNILGPEVARKLPHGSFHRFPGLGHAPQLSDPKGFHKVLLEWLSKGGVRK